MCQTKEMVKRLSYPPINGRQTTFIRQYDFVTEGYLCILSYFTKYVEMNVATITFFVYLLHNLNIIAVSNNFKLKAYIFRKQGRNVRIWDRASSCIPNSF